jgi:MFS family permease
MLPMRLFSARAFSAGSAAAFLLFGSLYATLFFIAQFLQIAQGYGPFDAGLRLLPWTATLFFVAPLAGALVNRLGERPLVVTGLLLQGVGMGWIATLAAPDLPFISLVAPLIIAGAGVSMAMPAVQTAIMGAVAQADIGKASGSIGMARFLGGVFGIAVAATVFAAAGSYASPLTFSAGFVGALVVSATLSLVGAVVALLMPGRAAAALRQAEQRA